jgi:MYXO-CTERM domain-containing protein
MQKPSRFHGLSILTGASLMLVAAPASADVELAPLVVIDLSAFDGSGFDPEPAAGQLDSDDWSVRLSATNVLDFGGSAGGAGSDYARGLSTGGVDDPAIWAFDVDGAGLIAFGIQPTDLAFTPGQVVLRLVNNTGADIAEFQVEYSIWVNNDVGRSNSLALEESADDITYNPVGDPFLSPEAADREGFTETEQVLLVTPAAPIADGANHYIQWSGNDASGAGPARDEFGIEGITIRLLNVCGNGLIEKDLDEECDDGLENSDTGACLSTCVAAACGDGFVQDGVEECDDANVDPGDGCAADCTVEVAETTGTDTGTATDTGPGPDSSGEGVSDSDTDTNATVTMTDATMTDPSDSSPDTGDEDTETDGAGEDDEAGCICSATGGSTPTAWALAIVVLGLLRRRRSR